MFAHVLVLPCIPLFRVPITLPHPSSPQQVQYPPPPTHQYRQPWGFQEYRVQNSSTPSILKGFLWLNRFQALKRLMSWEGEWTNCLTALTAPLLPPSSLPKTSKNWPMITSMRVPRRFPFSLRRKHFGVLLENMKGSNVVFDVVGENFSCV